MSITQKQWDCANEAANDLCAVSGKLMEAGLVDLSCVASDLMDRLESVLENNTPVQVTNSKMIAAAPDLLAALQRIVLDWDGEPEDMQEAQEAIRKATQ